MAYDRDPLRLHGHMLKITTSDVLLIGSHLLIVQNILIDYNARESKASAIVIAYLISLP